MLRRHFAASAAALYAFAGSAYAVFDPAMYSVNQNLASFTNLVATLDISTTSYAFPFDNAQYTGSGYVREVGGNIIDTTGLVTNVYQVTTQTDIGGLTLNVGDMIWAYTIDLVSAGATTVSSLSEFQVGGITLGGSDIMDGSLVLGRGFLTPDGAINTPIGNTGDFEDLGAGVGSSLDWQWSDSVAEQLGNDQTITLLMFTSAALIGDGLANFIAPPIQADGVDPIANGAPVLIPIAIPAPGAAGLLLGLGLTAWRRQR